MTIEDVLNDIRGAARATCERWHAELVSVSLQPPEYSSNQGNVVIDIVIRHNTGIQMTRRIEISQYEIMNRVTSHQIAQNAAYQLDEDMAQWNQNQRQQLQQREDQRRDARGQSPEPRAFSGGMAQTGRYVRPGMEIYDTYESTFGLNEELVRRAAQERQRYHETSMPPLQTGRMGGGGGGATMSTAGSAGISTIQYVNTIAGAGAASNTVTNREPSLNMSEAKVKELIQGFFDKLDIRISLTESDGEVTADVEVLLDGNVIASDSDYIQL